MAGTKIISTIFTVAHSITQQVFSVDKIHIFIPLNMQPTYIAALEYIFAHIYCFSYGEKANAKIEIIILLTYLSALYESVKNI